MKENVLVVAAHPDDETLGVGGAMARFSREGHSVSVVILGEGVTSRDESRKPIKRKRELQRLKSDVAGAARILGVKRVSVHDMPDNRFDTVAFLDIVKVVEKEILAVKPGIILTHSKADLNIDHIITHRAVLTAARPAAMPFVNEIYAFEIPSSTEWAFGSFGGFNPNVFIDITQVMNLKLKAMAAYRGELREFPHPRSIKAIKVQAANRGSTAGFECAEAFELIRRSI